MGWFLLEQIEILSKKVLFKTEFCSRHIDKERSIILITLHVVSLNEYLDLFFDHFWIGTEHADIAHHISHYLLESVRLLRLHNFNNMGLDYIGALFGHLFCLLRFFSSRLCCLLLHNFLRNQIAPDRLLAELFINFDLFLFTKHRLIDFLR